MSLTVFPRFLKAGTEKLTVWPRFLVDSGEGIFFSKWGNSVLLSDGINTTPEHRATVSLRRSTGVALADSGSAVSCGSGGASVGSNKGGAKLGGSGGVNI